MEGISNMFKTIASNCNGDVFDIYLSALSESQSFRTKNTDMMQTISSLLTTSEYRVVGLRLLFDILHQCSIEQLEDKFNLWLTQILKFCNESELKSNSNLIYKNLVMLGKRAHLSPDLSKVFASNALTKIYDSLIFVPSEGTLDALNCIVLCLNLYSGASSLSRSSIEKFLFRFVDSVDSDIVKQTAKCWLLLQQVRGGGVKGENYKLRWKDYQLCLLGSLHGLLDAAFVNCKEFYDGSVITMQLSITPLVLSDEPLQRNGQIMIRFCNLVDYLRVALSEAFPVEKTIFPRKILNIITRGLGVTCITLQKNPISDNLALGALIPKMHTKLLGLLEILIMCIGTNVKEFCNIILNLLLETLQWTSTGYPKGVKKPYGILRTTAYRVLDLWCSTLNSGSRCEIISGHLIKEIIYDISTYQNDFTLKMESGSRRHLAKKAHCQLRMASNNQTNLGHVHSNYGSIKKENLTDKGNQTLCVAALRCLQQVILSVGYIMKPTEYKIVHDSLMRLSFSLYDFPLKKEQLYYNSQCRIDLYNALYALILSPHPKFPPSTQLAVKILQSAAQLDHSSVIRRRAIEMISSLEKIIHPQKESLLFPADIREIKNAFMKFGQEILTHDVQFDSSNYLQNEDMEPDNCLAYDNCELSEDTVPKKFFSQNVTDGNDVNQQENNLSNTEELNDSIKTNSLYVENIIVDINVNCAKLKPLKNETSKDLSPSAKKSKLEDDAVELKKDKARLTECPLILKRDEDIIADLEAAFIDELI